jgi:hypothetical protein
VSLPVQTPGPLPDGAATLAGVLASGPTGSVAEWALVIATISLTIVTLGADNAIVRIVRILAPHRGTAHGKHEAGYTRNDRPRRPQDPTDGPDES